MSCCGDCEKKGQDIGPKPWPIHRYALDQNLLLRFISGESVVVEHRPIPQDAEVVSCRPNGTDTELYVRSQTFSPQTCKCTIPLVRVNYTTGG